jgi:hypothetical protein
LIDDGSLNPGGDRSIEVSNSFPSRFNCVKVRAFASEGCSPDNLQDEAEKKSSFFRESSGKIGIVRRDVFDRSIRRKAGRSNALLGSAIR